MTAQPVATVLVVDDNAMARATAVRAFRILNCTVVEAEDGPGALKQLAAHPDIVLLFTDLRMPGMSGADLAARAGAMRPGLRIVLTSGNAGGVSWPADVAFLRKPWRVAELKALLSEFTDAADRPA